MSHIVEGQTSIVQPDLVVLRQAVELVAGQHQGTVEPFWGGVKVAVTRRKVNEEGPVLRKLFNHYTQM